MADAASGRVLRRWDVPEDSGRRVLELCLGRNIELMIFAGEEIVLDPFSKASLMKTFPFPVFHDRRWWPTTPWLPGGAPPAPDQAPRGPGPRSLSPGRAGRPAGGPAHRRQRPRLRAGGRRGGQGPGPGHDRPALRRPLDRCAAVGDSDNDLAVLRAVGTPHRHGQHAAPQVKAACRLTVPSNGGGRRGPGHPELPVICKNARARRISGGPELSLPGIPYFFLGYGALWSVRSSR